MVILLAIITFGVVALTGVKYINTRRHVSSAVIRQLTVQAEARLSAFIQPVMTTMVIIKRWAASGDLAFTDPAALHPRLVPILEQHSQIYSVLVGSRKGPVYAIFRDADRWQAFTGKTLDGRPISGSWQQVQSSGETVVAPQNWRPGSADTRAILPEVDVEGSDDIIWSEPFELFPEGKIGLAAVTNLEPENREMLLALHVLMKDLREVINAVRIGDSFRLFIYSEDEVLIDFQRMDRNRITTGSAAASGRLAQDLQPLLITSALRQWQAKEKPTEPYAFAHQGARWWGLLHDFEAGADGGGVGILVTENDLIAQQKPEKYLFVPLAFALIWAAFFVFLRLHRRAAMLATREDRLAPLTEAELQEMISSGEQEKLEFKSTMRWNLKTDRAGKEIELAVLKTVAAFMNTDGGSLIIGVGDDGKPLGIEADQFTNEDGYLRHFGSLFNQHIGLEFTEFVDYSLHSLQGRRICVVNCRKSTQPVFVRHKKEESFFVRSGPSSRQLTVSQVIEYLKDRQR